MRRPFLPAALSCVLLIAVICSAQEKGYWRAASSNAGSITGDIEISDTKLTINFTGFTIAQIRRLSPAETSAVFAAESRSDATGNLYRLNVPAGKKFLHHNSLCGSDDVQWMVTSVADRTLATRHPEANLALWRAAGYEQPPDVSTMIAELARFPFRGRQSS